MAFNGNYVKIDTALNEISKYPFIEEMTKREASHLLVRLLGLLGATFPLQRKYVDIKINQHKGELPKDIMYIHGVNNKGYSCNNKGIPMKYASDIYHSALHSDEAKKVCAGKSINTLEEVKSLYPPTADTDPNWIANSQPEFWKDEKKFEKFYNENSYTINGMSIDTSFPYGYVELVYDSVPTDEDGYPMIPDDSAFREAYKYFLLKNAAEPAFFSGDINGAIFGNIEQKYYAYVGAAYGSLVMLSPDQMESMANSLLRIIPTQHDYRDGWRSTNRPNY